MAFILNKYNEVVEGTALTEAEAHFVNAANDGEIGSKYSASMEKVIAYVLKNYYLTLRPTPEPEPIPVED